MFHCEIDTGNAAFDEGSRNTELSRILRSVADSLDAEPSDGIGRANVRDINGNTCGNWSVSA
jgi:hypothetical protein